MIDVKQDSSGMIHVDVDGQSQSFSLNTSNQLIKCARMNNFNDFCNMLVLKSDLNKDHVFFQSLQSLSPTMQWKFKEQFARLQTTVAH